MSHLKFIIGAIIFIAVLGYVGSKDYQQQLYEQTVNVCELSRGETLLADGRKCNQLITATEATGVEVLSNDDGAHFWIESK